MNEIMSIRSNILQAVKLNSVCVSRVLEMLVVFVSLMFFVQIFAAPAQAATYAFRNNPFVWDAPSGAATSVAWSGLCTAFPGGDDDYALVNFPSGFTFTFAGTAYSQVRVMSNGMIQFGAADQGIHRDYTPVALPAPASNIGVPGGCPNVAPTNVLQVYWLDINTAPNIAGALVKYELLGASPNRRFVITYSNVKLYTAATLYTFQVVLNESTVGVNGNFEYRYTTGGSDGIGATVGVQVGATDFTQYAFNQAFIDPAAGTAILWYPANQLAAKGAEYRFDEGAWTGVAGEVTDTSGNNQNATRLGAVTNVTAGKLCRGGSFTANTLNTTMDAIATPIVPANQGAMSFWYKSNNAWNTADAMLFDATTVAVKPFFLMKRSTGALRFVVTDSAGTVRTAETTTAYTFAANTWQHIAVSWSLRPGTNQTVLQIFVNGALANTLTLTPFRTTTSGTIAALSTLYIGDNRTSGITPNTGSPNGANGTIDEVYIYPIEINATQASADMALTRPACTTLDHLHIVHGGSQVSCGGAVANVTIEAHDVNHALFTLSGTTMNLSTSTAHGTWSAVTAINPVTNTAPGNVGSATYTFSGESSVVLGLSNTIAETLNINLGSGGITELSGAATPCVASDYTFGTTCDTNLDFSQAGFRFVDSAGNPIATQISGTTSATYYLQAVKNTCTAPGACTGVCSSMFPSGTSVNIGLASECNNPAICQAGQQVTFATASPVTTGALAANNNGTISATTGTYTTKAVTFNAVAPNPTPSAPFTVNYSDVGQINLWARYPATGVATMTNSSGAFVVAPHHFSFSGVTASPIKAGASFSATVTAYNGLTVPTATPNFGKETAPENATLTFSKCKPTGTSSSNGIFSGSLGVFASGAATANSLSWSEVGNGDMIATLTSGSYLGSALTATGNTGTGGIACNGSNAGNVGFVPDHFDTVVTGSMACPSPLICTPPVSTMVYSGQAFTTNVIARNAAGATTQNYDGTVNTSPNFAKTVTLTAWDGLGSTTTQNPPAVTPGSIASGGTIALTAFNKGTTISPGTPSVPIYTFGTIPTSPTDIFIRAANADATSLRVPANTSVEGGVKVASGRIKIANAHGSELLQLPIQVVAQYWNGSNYVTSSTDSVTIINAATVNSGNWTNLTPSNWQKQPASSTWAAGATSVVPATANVILTNGVGSFRLAAPGNNVTGSVDLLVNAPAYLSTVNKARATFGGYKGSNELIYMRENY